MSSSIYKANDFQKSVLSPSLLLLDGDGRRVLSPGAMTDGLCLGRDKEEKEVKMDMRFLSK